MNKLIEGMIVVNDKEYTIYYAQMPMTNELQEQIDNKQLKKIYDFSVHNKKIEVYCCESDSLVLTSYFNKYY